VFDIILQTVYNYNVAKIEFFRGRMKYINEEYGFAFRPPFHKQFREVKDTGVPLEQIKFPGQFMQGVGYDYSAINGAMLIGKNGTMWGIRVSYFEGSKWLENDDFIERLGAGCANTQDGSFAHFTSGPLSVKWVKHNEQSLIIQVSSRKTLRIRVVFYPCYKWAGELSIQGAQVKGRAPYIGIVPGNIKLTDTHAEYRDRYRVHFEDDQKIEYFIAQSYAKPADSANGAFNEAIMEFIINKQQHSVYLYAAVSDQNIFDNSILPKLERVINQINSAELRYGVDKTNGTGILGMPAERMQNSIHWSRIYYPFLLTEIYSPKRSMLNNHFDIDGLEENCSALLGCFAGGASYAAKQLKYTIGDKIFSVLTIWHIFCHSTNKKDLHPLYNQLKEIYKPIVELVVTTTPEKNEVAYKWSDSPLKERRDASPMYSLDLSCIKLLAFDVLARMAEVYEDAIQSQYESAKEQMKKLVNEVFWNEKEGMYVNRYVSNKWANRESIGATSFYVLLCDAVDSSHKLSLIVNNLLSVKKFWTEFPIPTLSAISKEYGKKSKPNNNGFRSPPYLEYRGSVIPYVNYIIYHGLVRYGLDEIASKLAVSSSKLWTNNKTDNVENYSVYLPSGKRVKTKNYLSSNGNMLALIGVQEMLDIEYFKEDSSKSAIRFGTFAMGSNSLTNVKLLDKIYSIDINDTETVLLYENKQLFHGEGGKFVVRNFGLTNTGCEFIVDAHANININLSIPSQTSKKVTKYFLIVPVGKYRVYAENGMHNMRPIVLEDNENYLSQSFEKEKNTSVDL